jgi:1-acyl-sn-glycerol-3-phosphate acyltransferase
VFPLSQLLPVSLSPKQWPGLRVHSVCASVLFKIPIWRHMLSWLGIRPATRSHFVKLLRRHGSVKVNPGGIAEMYLIDPSAEVIKIRERKGFVRIAVEHGVPLLPVYHFGNSRLLNYGPKVCVCGWGAG